MPLFLDQELTSYRYILSCSSSCWGDVLILCRVVVAGPIGSKLSDKFGCRAITMTGGLLLCIGLVLCSLATRLFQVYLALGIVAGMNFCTLYSYVNTSSAYAYRECFVMIVDMMNGIPYFWKICMVIIASSCVLSLCMFNVWIKRLNDIGSPEQVIPELRTGRHLPYDAEDIQN